MKLQSKNIFIALQVLLISVASAFQVVKAQGIFQCPLEETSGNHLNEVFIIDQVPFHINQFGLILDYKCTESKSDIGITATHFELVPAGIQYINTPIARVVAAAAGQIVDKYNLYDDLTCNGYHSTGNYIKIQHANGMTTKYLFLRKNSLTNKSIGDFVAEGEFLAYPGNQSSSGFNGAQYGGFSFEVRNTSNTAIDPFETSDTICTIHQRISLWKNTAYMDDKVWKSRMLAVAVDNAYVQDSCGWGIDRFKSHFNYGDLIDVIVKLYNPRDSLLFNIFNPFGFPITSTLGKDYANYTFSFDRTAFVKFDVPLTGTLIIPGTYTVDCIWYDSYTGYQTVQQTMRQYFTVGCVADYTLIGQVSNYSGCIAGNNIYSSEVCNSGAGVKYVAGNEIILNPGFRAYNGSDVFIYTDPCVVTPRLSNQIENRSDIKDLEVFPNPSNDFITVKILDADVKTVFKIYNSTMQLMKSINVESGLENKIAISSLSPGIYFIDVQTKDQSYKTKFIVSR